jgi:predicted AAA+ superfamily ATPase
MNRAIYNQLKDWKKDPKKKPLLLQGARQVGKTYIVSEFGKKEYSNFIYLNFEQDNKLHAFFKGAMIPKEIIENLGIYLGRKIEAKETLLFFDEIQVLPEVLTSLKYFNEQAKEFHIIAAGSLLGVSIASHTSFPVGKINFLTMYPMSFYEYLHAIEESLLEKEIAKLNEQKPLNEVFHNELIKHLKMYLYLGGMPEVVQDYIQNKDISTVRKIQNEILEAYKRDFSKYNDKRQAFKTSQVWKSVPYQLAKENKKFKYGEVKSKARAADYEQAIEWLKNAGLVNDAQCISTPKLPISGYADQTKFKLYLFDTGLLGALLKISSSMIVDPSALYTEYNGIFLENFVAQELTFYQKNQLHYWSSKSDAEVDFILEVKDEIYPLEVKSGLNRNKKSLQSYATKYKPKYTFRISPRNLHISGNFINFPLYAVQTLNEVINYTINPPK